MGDNKKCTLRVEFDRRLKLEFHGAKVTSDGGLLLYRELDEVLGLTPLAEEVLHETRKGKNTQHSRTALLRQSVYSRLAGYEDTNDADRLRVDPAMGHVVGGRAARRLGPSTSQMNRFETQMLTRVLNRFALMDLCGRWVDRVNEVKYTVRWTRLSCHDFQDNEVRLQLFALAYNLGNFLRQIALPKRIERWSLTTLREKLIKIGAKVVQHAKYVTFQLGEFAVPRELFSQILERIDFLRYAPDSG